MWTKESTKLILKFMSILSVYYCSGIQEIVDIIKQQWFFKISKICIICIIIIIIWSSHRHDIIEKDVALLSSHKEAKHLDRVQRKADRRQQIQQRKNQTNNEERLVDRQTQLESF